jgi:hypothetical protein
VGKTKRGEFRNIFYNYFRGYSMALIKHFVIWENDTSEDWQLLDTFGRKFSTYKQAEDFLLDMWRDFDLTQTDYKMDNYQIEDEYERV